MNSNDDKTEAMSAPPPDAPAQAPGNLDKTQTMAPGQTFDYTKTWPPNYPVSFNALPFGTRVAEFEVTDLVGEGGFGIVYLAQDHSLGRRVALKEYMPTTLAARTESLTVSVKSAAHSRAFDAGLRSFVNEARLLAQFDHPALVKVYRFWEESGTAYMVMPFYEGLTLKQRLLELGAPPSENWLRQVLAPLLDALEVMHREQCFHRDIAPDNILLLKGDKPILLDFGAARQVIGDLTHSLTVILKPGFAPVEQYGDSPSMKQGPWTDLFALGGVIYYAIKGTTPPNAVTRMAQIQGAQDSYVPLEQSLAGQYSASFLRAIDRALEIAPGNRPQSVAQFRELLFADPPIDRDDVSAPLAPTAPSQPVEPPTPGAEPAPPPAPSVAAPSGKGKRVALLAALALLGAGAAYLVKPGLAPAPTPVAMAPAPGPAAPPATPLPENPFDPVDILDNLFQQRDREHTVTIEVGKSKVRIGNDQFGFRLASSRGGYAYVFMVGSQRSDFNLIFPNDLDKNNRVEPGKTLALPRSDWAMVSAGPAGFDHFLVVVSDRPRDFSQAGLQATPPFAAFPLAAARERMKQGDALAFIGEPRCGGDDACSSLYGAATFTIEEVKARQ